MPIYNYFCKECQQTFEIFSSIEKALEDKHCPNCNSMVIKQHSRINVKTSSIPDPYISDPSDIDIASRTPIYTDRNTGKQFLGNNSDLIIRNKGENNGE
ncbi:MAG: FmdB family zinc ribbon protein [archaeon]